MLAALNRECDLCYDNRMRYICSLGCRGGQIRRNLEASWKNYTVDRRDAENVFCFAKWSLIGTGNVVKIGTTSCRAYSFANPIGAPFTLRLIS